MGCPVPGKRSGCPDLPHGAAVDGHCGILYLSLIHILRRAALLGMAEALCSPARQQAILDANAADLEAARGHISEAMLDRLALTPERINAMAKGIREVADLPDPVGKVLRREMCIRDRNTRW